MDQGPVESIDISRSSGVVEEEFRSLFDQLYGPLVRFFARNGVATMERDDLTQETLMRAYRAFSTYRGEAGRVTWIFSIARNVLKNKVRDDQAGKRQGDEVSMDSAEDPSQPNPWDRVSIGEGATPWTPLTRVLQQEKCVRLREALERLPAKMKHCTQLRLQDLQYNEIAAVMRISIDTVKAHLFQARKKLKTELGEYFAELDFEDDHDD